MGMNTILYMTVNTKSDGNMASLGVPCKPILVEVSVTQSFKAEIRDLR